MPDAIFFDLDGTLADTALDLGSALNHLLSESGMPPLPQAAIRPHVSQGVRGLLAAGFSISPEHPKYNDFQVRFLDHYANSLCAKTSLFDGIEDFLTTIESQNILWGVVTNKSSRYALPILDSLGLARRTACIICGDSATQPKPAPEPLLLASTILDVDPSQCLYIGDDLRDIQAAHAAEMDAVAAAWGYLGDDLPLENWGADHIMRSPADLVELLR